MGSFLPETRNSLVETREGRLSVLDVLLVDFGTSSGWVWTGAVLCRAAEAALEGV